MRDGIFAHQPIRQNKLGKPLDRFGLAGPIGIDTDCGLAVKVGFEEAQKGRERRAMRGFVIAGIQRIFWQGQLVPAHQRRSNAAIATFASIENAVAKNSMGAGQRMAQHAETAVPGMIAHPIAQRILPQLRGRLAIRHFVEGAHPLLHRVTRPASDRQIQKRGRVAGKISRYCRSTTRFKIWRPRQVEPVQPRECFGHLAKITDLIGKRAWVLNLQVLVQCVQPSVDAQPCRKAIHHLHVLEILIRDIKCSLPGHLQTVQQTDLKFLQGGQMCRKFISVKARLGVLARFGICQFPLTGRNRNLPRDVTICRVAGQHNLGAFSILHDLVEHARVMIVEIAKPRQVIRRFANLTQEPFGVVIARGLGHTQNMLGLGIANEMRIERLAMTGQPIDRVQVRFQKV
mmetsp:Transcript_17998/g.27405  ORF Transcript_17998/g.27405 Transcript_17998/m.27405 type:complete len:401 (+) Transcript_17998:6044-7246(+)